MGVGLRQMSPWCWQQLLGSVLSPLSLPRLTERLGQTFPVVSRANCGWPTEETWPETELGLVAQTAQDQSLHGPEVRVDAKGLASSMRQTRWGSLKSGPTPSHLGSSCDRSIGSQVQASLAHPHHGLVALVPGLCDVLIDLLRGLKGRRKRSGVGTVVESLLFVHPAQRYCPLQEAGALPGHFRFWTPKGRARNVWHGAV